MLELHIADTNIDSGTVSISWCVSKEELADLIRQEIRNPLVILCAAPITNYHINKEVRSIVPLKDLMAYLELRSAGENTIVGFVSYKTMKAAKSYYLHKDNGEYTTHILSPDGTDFSDFFKVQFAGSSAPITVSLPKEVFAPPPSQWEQDWVNFIWRNKPMDQCDFRKRRLWAYSLQPIMFFFMAIPKLLALLLSILILDKGIWDVLKTIFHPITYFTPDHSFAAMKGSILLYSWPTEKEDFDSAFRNKSKSLLLVSSLLLKRLMFFPFAPLIWIPIAIGIYCSGLLHCLITIAIIIAFVVFMIGLTCLSESGIFQKSLVPFFNKIASFFSKLFGVNDELWYLNEEAENLLLCSNEKKPTSYKQVPRKYRSIRLRFSNLKSQVCRPFSR